MDAPLYTNDVGQRLRRIAQSAPLLIDKRYLMEEEKHVIAEYSLDLIRRYPDLFETVNHLRVQMGLPSIYLPSLPSTPSLPSPSTPPSSLPLIPTFEPMSFEELDSLITELRGPYAPLVNLLETQNEFGFLNLNPEIKRNEKIYRAFIYKRDPQSGGPLPLKFQEISRVEATLSLNALIIRIIKNSRALPRPLLGPAPPLRTSGKRIRFQLDSPIIPEEPYELDLFTRVKLGEVPADAARQASYQWTMELRNSLDALHIIRIVLKLIIGRRSALVSESFDLRVVPSTGQIIIEKSRDMQNLFETVTTAAGLLQYSLRSL